MRLLLTGFILFALGPAFAAVTGVQVGDPGRQQGVITFRVANPAQCRVTVYRDEALTDKVNDTNESIFTGSEACQRAYNVVDGTRITAVIGRRTSEVGSDGKLYSRSLEVSKTFYATITDLTDNNVAKVSFTTTNIPWGDTHPEEVPFNAAGFDRYAFPNLDWSDAGLKKSYVDPMTGLLFRRTPRYMVGGGGDWFNNPTQEYAFKGAFEVQPGWTNAQNVLSTSAAGPFASYSGTTRAPLFLSFAGNTQAAAPFSVADNVWEDTRINIYGSAASTGNTEDSKVLLCLGANYVPSSDQCTKEIELTLPSSTGGPVSAPSSYPAFQFAGWQLGRFLSSEEASVNGGSSATVTNSSVVLGNGNLLPNVQAGMKININGNWYTIGTLDTATTFKLAESNVNTSGAWFMGNFGIRLRKKTTTNNQIQVAATFSLVYTHSVEQPANGVPDFCSRLTFPVDYEADGTTPLSPPKQGRLCMAGTNESGRFMFLLLDDGETRFISSLQHQDYSYVGSAAAIPFGAFSRTDPFLLLAKHTDDSGPAGAPERQNSAIYKVTYDPSLGCHFRSWSGNAYKTNPSPQDDCVRWVNQTPYTAGNTITQQIAAALQNNFSWDPSFTNNFEMTQIAGNYAVFSKSSSAQNNMCWLAIFDLRTYQLVKLFDTFNSAGMRWGGCHSNGIDGYDGGTQASVSVSLLTSHNVSGYLSGPFHIQSILAKSLDGGATWNSDTSLTNTQAAACGTNPYGITGLQCLKLKISSDRPCSFSSNPTDADVARWPCPWKAASSSPMTLEAGDYFSTRDTPTSLLDGKHEKFRILSKVANGDGTFTLEVQRWSTCDNIDSDFSKGAVQYYDHLYTGITNSVHPNGWIGFMTPTGVCAGNPTWFNLDGPTSIFNVDASQLTSSHNTIGIAPDGVRSLQVGPGVSRLGVLPQMLDHAQDYVFDTGQAPFAGIPRVSSGEVEQYPSLGNWMVQGTLRRGQYYDFRHINPDTGSYPEVAVNIWSQNYTKVTGQSFTYKMDVYQGVASQKERRPSVFSSRGTYQDISGPGSLIDDTKMYTYCIAYKAGECRPDSTVNAVYVVTRNANIAGGNCITDTFRVFAPCATSLWTHAAWMIQDDAMRDDPLGKRYRRLTMAMTGPGAQYQYTSPHMTPDGNFALVRAGWPEGVRPDMLVYKIPPPPQDDTRDRSQYVPIAVSLPAGSGYARIRFGYAENGTVSNFYCTSRRESCLTDRTVAPFAFEQSDTLSATDCRTGCTIKVPALPGRVIYYRVETSTDGSTGWVSGDVRVSAIN